MIAVGTLATYHIGSDSYGYVVVDSTDSGKTIWLVPKSGFEQHQKLPYKMGREDPACRIASQRKNKLYRWKSQRVGFITLGKAVDYLSPEF